MKQLIYILTLLTLVSVGACSKHNDPIPTTTTSRTVMVYLEMNNNLSEYGEKNIADMVTGTTKENLNGGKIIAYIKTYNESKIASITYDKNNKGTLVTLREVDRSINMSNWEVLQNFIIEAKQLAPAKEYGLILASHSIGWLPTTNNANPTSRINDQTIKIRQHSFGEEAGKQMEIKDLARALQAAHFKFVLFDACLMGCIEVLYELKSSTDYLICSPTEVPAAGMNYKQVIPLLFKQQPELKNVCEAYMKRYPSDGVIALYDLTKIEAIQTAFKAIVQQVGSVNIQSLTYLNIYETQNFCNYWGQKRWAFDMMALAEKTTTNELLLNQLNTAINELIVYKNFAPNPFNYINITRFCGLGMTLPLDEYSSSWKQCYKNTQWFKSCYNFTYSN